MQAPEVVGLLLVDSSTAASGHLVYTSSIYGDQCSHQGEHPEKLLACGAVHGFVVCVNLLLTHWFWLADEGVGAQQVEEAPLME